MDNQEFIRGGSEKLEFRQIVLQQIKKILEISSEELRNKTTEFVRGNIVEKTEHEDTRVSYAQAIENLAYILKPHFDNEMKKVYKECIKIVDGYDYEIREILKDMYEEIKKETGNKELGYGFTIAMRQKYAKKLFIELNMLLKRNDYLKSAVYSEIEENKQELIEVDK